MQTNKYIDFTIKKFTILIIGLCLFNYYSIASDTLTYDYYEQDGLVVIEPESLDLPAGWEKKSNLGGFSGHAYMEWIGSDNFNSPGKGLVNIAIKISNPGIYTIQWRNKVGKGVNSTEHNDSWLRIPDASEFYAVQGDKKLFPHGVCTDHCPEGSGSDGWFKVFLSFTTDWTWASYTSDNEGYHLRAKFDTVGVYNLQISGRSMHHIIDRIVLFNETVNESDAQNLSAPETLVGESPYGSYASPKSSRAIKFSDAITIDGEMDETWSTAYSDSSAFLVVSSTLYEADDYSFSFKTAYDNDNLYLFGQFVDDQVISEKESSSSVQADAFELYINPSYTHDSNGVYKDDDAMLRFLLGDENSMEGIGNWVNSMDDIAYANKKNEQGYQAEIAIPWNVLMGDNYIISPDHVIGFDFMMIDSDSTSSIGKIAWANDTKRDSAFADTRVFGSLLLEQGNPECPGGPGCASEKHLDILQVFSIPVIDGKADDWSNFSRHQAIQNIAGSTPSASDFKVDFAVAYDNEFFYILADVKDELTQGMKNSSSPYLYDNIELFFNPDNKHNPGGAFGEDGIQVRMNYGENSHYSGTGSWKGDAEYNGFEYISSLTDNGYIIEGKIPWAGIFGELFPEQGLTFGFDISIGDNDGGSSRDNILGWANDTQKDIGYLDTRVFGFATFGDLVAVHDAVQNDAMLNVYLNQESLHVKGLSKSATLKIYSVFGTEIMQAQINDTHTVVSLNQLKAGVYIITINNQSFSIIKQ